MNFANPRIRANSNDDGMIPLINIVFLLLIFFMVAGTISTSDAVIVSPPKAHAQSPVARGQSVIIIGHDLELYLDNQLISAPELTQKLALMQENLLDSTASPPAAQGVRVLIKADGQLEMRELQTVLDCVKQAGIADISLATSLSNKPISKSRYEL